MVADISGGRLLRYAKNGRFLGSAGTQTTSIGEYRPVQIHLTRDGFLVRSRAYEWFELDRNFKLLRHIRPEGAPRLAMLGEVLTGNEVAGFGTFRKSDQSWGFGVLRVRLSPLELIESFDELSLSSKEGTLYTSLAPEAALANGAPYVLRFGEPSAIVNVRTRQRLKSFPPGFERLPTLPQATGPDSEAPRAQVLEKSTMPVALYGYGAYLYVLTRRPDGDGKTVWQLHRIDPARDALTGSVTLPTSAAQVVLAPGKDFWALLEKGGLASAQQEGRSLRLIPAAAVEKGNGQIPCP